MLVGLLAADDICAESEDAIPEHANEPAPEEGFLEPNAADSDGTAAYVHITPEQMPLRVSMGYPRTGIRHGTREDARLAAIEGIRLWEEALGKALPWFAIEIVEHDAEAPVQVLWRRRLPSIGMAGRGGPTWKVVDGELRVGGRMELTTTHAIATDYRLEAAELRLLVAHEFGHVLGLMHCHHCESAMNYSWETRERIVVTDLDVHTFRALLRKPNGVRTDGKPLLALREKQAATSDAAMP